MHSAQLSMFLTWPTREFMLLIKHAPFILLRSTTLSPQCPVGHATVLLTRLGPTYLQMQAFFPVFVLRDFPGLCTPLLHLLSGAGPTWLPRISGMPPLGVASTVGTFGTPLSACNFF